MSHLKSISFDNFRIFKNKTHFELSPITYLTGPNSSGKSSLLKALLLLKSNYTSDLQVLDFSGPKHNLGTFDNALNKNNIENDTIVFGLKASINLEAFPFSYNKSSVTTRRSVYHVLFESKSKSDQDIYIELTYKKNERSGKLQMVEIFLDNESRSFLKLEFATNLDNHHSLRLDTEQIAKNKSLRESLLKNLLKEGYKLDRNYKSKSYKILSSDIQSQKNTKFYDEPVLIFSKLFEKFVSENISHSVNKDFHNFLLSLPLRRFLKDFAALIDNVEYLEAVRANTKRLYTNDSQGTSFNELILEYRSRDISEKSIQFTNKWLQKFEIADEILFENVEGVATTIYLKKGNSEIALADLGYGITQFLPILLKIALEEPIRDNPSMQVVKKLILLEEPETNLHPKLQSLIADFLLDSIKTFEVRFIIETHSEYIIRKTQILTAEKELKLNEAVIYYFNSVSSSEENEDFEQIQKIAINENGTLAGDFGEGFFDEATNLKFELLKIKSSKKK